MLINSKKKNPDPILSKSSIFSAVITSKEGLFSGEKN